jgi:hypothetical protein
MDATDTLPDDTALLKQLLIERESTIEQIKREAAEQVETMRQQLKEEAAAAIEVLKQEHHAEMEAVFRRFYGPKSERFDLRQLLIFGVLIDAMPLRQQAIETRREAQHAAHSTQAWAGQVARIAAADSHRA